MKNMLVSQLKDFIKGILSIICIVIVGIAADYLPFNNYFFSSDFLVVELPFVLGFIIGILMLIKKKYAFGLGLIFGPFILMFLATITLEPLCGFFGSCP